MGGESPWAAGALTFLVGGARSGKSTLAVALGRRFDGDVVFVATAEAGDDDMAARIERHRAERPGWPTVEASRELVDAVTSSDPTAMLIVDCLTLWVANLVLGDVDAGEIAARAAAVADALRRRQGPSVVISNEVGMGIIPDHPLGRHYRDVLGTVNQVVARRAVRTLLLVAGRTLELNDPLELLP